MKARELVLLSIALGVVAHPLAASALTLPPASGYETIYDLSQTTFGTLTYYVCPGCSATALPGSASATNSGIGANVDSSSEYYYAVVGPSSPVAVTVHIAGTTAATAVTGEGQAQVYAAGSVLVSYACAGTCSPTGPPITTSFLVDVNTPVEILMLASADDGTSSANADPYISIDPSTPNASEYSIEVSTGVSNVPVPEPGGLGLLASGLMGIAVLSRRRGH